MERQFSVTVCGKQAGKVLVQRKGLYYYFQCRCGLSGDIIYRLVVTCSNIRESLGILVPKDGCFVLDTKVPVKKIGAGEWSFELVPKHETAAGTFVPICPEEPFAYIARLKKSFLVLQNGQAGIYISQKQEC